MTRFFVLAAVLILCDVEASDCSEKGKVYNNTSFDYLLFVQEWVPGFCAFQTEPCQVPDGKPRWTMHGLWPTSDDPSKYPSYCFPYKFDLSKIASLVGALNSSWPNSFVKQAYYCLWEHEYEKHGTCASVLPQFKTQYDFFNTTMNIREKLDFYSALSSSDIVPSSNRTYKGSVIRAAFRNYFGVDPYLQCECKGPRRILFQVSFCLSKDTLSVFECSENIYKRSCCKDDDEVWYYPWINEQ